MVRNMFNLEVISILLVCLVTIQSVSGEENPRGRRSNGQVTGLYPFPRVGRSDPELANWNAFGAEDFENVNPRKQLVLIPKFIEINDNMEANDRAPHWRQAGHDTDNTMSKRGVDQPGIWFGPRLGRLQK